MMSSKHQHVSLQMLRDSRGKMHHAPCHEQLFNASRTCEIQLGTSTTTENNTKRAKNHIHCFLLILLMNIPFNFESILQTKLKFNIVI